jgi:hypothetical protein
LHGRAALVFATLATVGYGCGSGYESDSGHETHPPQSAPEKALASRFRTFAALLERGTRRQLCDHATHAFAESLKCELANGPRLPYELRGVEVRIDQLLVHGRINAEPMLGAPLREAEQGNLLLHFKRVGTDDSRVESSRVDNAQIGVLG